MSTLTFPRFFSTPKIHPFDTVEWDIRHARIVGEDGETKFEQEGVEFPSFWSEQATNIVASKYFRVVNGEREKSVRQMIGRVVRTITEWGYADGYFDGNNSSVFWEELTHILLNQYASFNSPVWFNVGVQERPQSSACFLLDVEDSMESILEWYTTEGIIFKGGSGAGINLSNIRPKGAPLSGGGKASGVMSFARVADANAGAIASGGTTRRAAKLLVLDVDHPEIEDFIECKVKAEAMARALIAAGYKDGLEEEVRQTIPFQNANNSVNVSDAFMAKVLDSLQPHQQSCLSSRLFRKIAHATWACGDPGALFGDTVNRWHTTPSRGPVRSGNPCQEVVQAPNTACNLASINLLKFLKDDGSFDIPTFKHTVNVLITAQDILVDRSSYPTEKIAENSKNFRPLGLGYANLGALLMAKGMAYDSDEGRSYAGSITALMTGAAYEQSAVLAQVKGPFAGFEANRDAMNTVIGQHRHACYNLGEIREGSTNLVFEAMSAWDAAYAAAGMTHGFRNAQVTLLAPTGTISFMMDCQTTGIEPDIALVKYKKLVGGGTLKMVNTIVWRALETLGYSDEERKGICAYVYDGGTLALHPYVKPEHAAIFDCALPASPGGRALSWESHVKMVAAVQPFLSGGVSKTINMPSDATVEDVERAFIMAWKLGLKSVAIYRDGCKALQPVTTQKPGIEEIAERVERGEDISAQFTREYTVHSAREHNVEPSGALVFTPLFTPTRKRLPDERPALTHKFNIAGSEGYLHVGLYPETGEPGELFIHMAKEGSTVSGLMDTIGVLTSLLLQHGVPLKTLTDKLSNTRFEPAGITTNPDIRVASSPIDYIFRWLAGKYEEVPDHKEALAAMLSEPHNVATLVQSNGYVHTNGNGHGVAPLDAPVCPECGCLMIQRAGACFVCGTCGVSSGCS